jgi:sec-independent protein translocase protein TatA
MLSTLAIFSMPRGMELLIILAIVLLIFGRRLPEMMRGLGKGIVEFKKGLKGIEEDPAATADQQLDAAKEPRKIS